MDDDDDRTAAKGEQIRPEEESECMGALQRQDPQDPQVVTPHTRRSNGRPRR